ncbi:hypothetical protein Ga0100231_023085 [Opitutaceae bacterium TAV4]|nr:hypothetical protein Ga0100231_023085 [Opitutaceae bacterium TAV4]
MPRVLIISPRFAPVNAPDMQRVRLALPHLRAHGWDPVVLALAPDCIEGAVREPLLEQTYPDDIRVIRVRGLPARLTRPFGFGNLWWRCGYALRRAGDALLAQEKFDLVFFSTTQFDAFSLGPRWLRRFGVPYVLDYQDPWVNDYYARTRTRPPGGPLKFALSQFKARRREPDCVRHAAAIIAVSPAYLETLRIRYPDTFARPRQPLPPPPPPPALHALPFGAADADLAHAARHIPARPLVNFDDGLFHHVYTGRLGPDMTFALTVLFRAFRRFRDSHPAAAARQRFHFIGTDYAPPPLGREWALPLARSEGIETHVTEHCARIPYFESLHYLARAQALTLPGSTDSTYSASKIFPCLLARRPLLLIFHHASPVLQFAASCNAGIRIAFSDTTQATASALAAEVCERWFEGGAQHAPATLDETAFRPFTAAALTARLAGIFDAAVVPLPPR